MATSSVSCQIYLFVLIDAIVFMLIGTVANVGIVKGIVTDYNKNFLWH